MPNELLFSLNGILLIYCLEENRIARCHAIHHHDRNFSFCAYGIVCDQVYKSHIPNFADLRISWLL